MDSSRPDNGLNSSRLLILGTKVCSLVNYKPFVSFSYWLCHCDILDDNCLEILSCFNDIHFNIVNGTGIPTQLQLADLGTEADMLRCYDYDYAMTNVLI